MPILVKLVICFSLAMTWNQPPAPSDAWLDQLTVRRVVRIEGVPQPVNAPSAGLIGVQGEKKMLPFKKCPVCGGEVIEKEVEKLLRGGQHTAKGTC